MNKERFREQTDKVGEGVQTAERPWGTWTVLKEGAGYKVKLIEVSPGQRLSLQFHHHRTEHWVVVTGTARVIIGNHVLELRPFESAVIPVGAVHRLENPGADPLLIVEVQKGEVTSEEDIVRLEDDYQRASPRSE
ncbi:MAG: phosphomannose isomerase type II C-terminal cupin domain [Candidatus Methylomirabilales bacterium]